MHTQSIGRRTVLTLIVSAFAALAFASTALAAPTVTITTAPAGTTASVTDNLFHTTTRGSSFVFNVVGDAPLDNVTATCALDGAAPVACGSGSSPQNGLTFNGGSGLDLGSHELVITANDTTTPSGPTTKKYTWRVEPVGYASHVISDGPESYFKFDDNLTGSNQTVVDSSGNGHNGQNYNYVLGRRPALTACQNQPHPPYACNWLSDGAPFSGPEPKGYSFYFGGNPNDNYGIQSDDSVDWHDSNFPSSGWTVEMWVKPTAVGEYQGLYEHDAVIWIDDTNHVNCAQMNDQGTPSRVATSTLTISSGSKYYIACKRTANVVDLFVYKFSYSTGPAPSPDHSTATAVVDPSNNMDEQGKIGLVNVPTYANFDGYIDNVADYYSPLSNSEIQYHWELGAVDDDWYGQWKKGATTAVTQDVAPPSAEPVGGGTSIASPANNSQYSPDAQAYKAPTASFSCWDPQPDTGNNSQMTSGTQTAAAGCTATVDGNPILNGAALPLTSGTHTFVLTATDAAGNTWTHTHTYYVTPTNAGYFNVIMCSNPIVASPGCDSPLAYYRFDEAAGAGTIVDSTTNGYNGDYKNDQDNSGNSGVVGGSGPNGTRAFFGQGGYAAINNIDAPLYGYTLEGWWKPYDDNGMAIMQHGSNGTIWYDGTNVNFRPDERSPVTASIALPTPSASGNWYYVAGSYDGVTATLYVRESKAGNLTLNSASVPFHAKDGAGSADTFYLGFANDISGVTSPWLRGELDEVAYYGTALASSKLTQHFNADPPAGNVKYAKTPASSSGGTPASGDSKKPSAHKPSKLAAAKAKVKAASKAVAKAKAKLRVLKAHHASKKAIHKAQVNVKVKTKALAKAKARVRALTRH
jgi:hypothetical protein